MSLRGMQLAHRWVGPGLVRWVRPEIAGAAGVPSDGGVLMASNHRSFLDHYLLAAASPRPVRFLGKSELARGPVGLLHRATGMISVERGSGDLGTIETLTGLLRAGEAVALFPEGTKSPTGELFRFRGGVGRIAAAAGVPIVPVGLVGTAQVWPRGGSPTWRRPRRGQVAVRFGEPMEAPDDDPRARRAFIGALRKQVAALCEQPLADSYAPIRRD
ncbi:MAG TPA: lysophospholipid acyltransferase family protein [Egibacteraceae bacterium]|nr:lysophospholipid acyltransferase family protein [Egibacteraceae bacterium]